MKKPTTCHFFCVQIEIDHLPAPHTFEENIAAEKSKLEAQVAKLKPDPGRAPQKDQS